MIATISVVFLHTSSGLLDTREIDNQMVRFALSCEKYLLEYAVPLFVLISGALFFNPSKSINYSKLIHKNIKRIVLALLFFGFPMCLMEVFFTDDLRLEGVLRASLNFITGRCWNHMFYLYMLIGLYLLTPVLKPFLINCNNRDLGLSLVTMFVLSSLLPTLGAYGVRIGSYMIIGTPYIFIYMLGYVLAWRIDETVIKNGWCWGIVFVCAAIVVIKSWLGIKSVQYIDPMLILMASAIFLLAKNYQVALTIAERFVPYSFGIYIIHPVFTNLAYKLFDINEYQVYKPIYYLLWGTLFLLLSWLSVWIMLRIRPLKEYVL